MVLSHDRFCSVLWSRSSTTRWWTGFNSASKRLASASVVGLGAPFSAVISCSRSSHLGTWTFFLRALLADTCLVFLRQFTEAFGRISCGILRDGGHGSRGRLAVCTTKPGIIFARDHRQCHVAVASTEAGLSGPRAEMAVNPAHAAPVVPGDDGEGFCNARSTGFCGGLSEAWRSSQARLVLGGDLVGSSCPWPLEENSLPGRSSSPCSPAQVYFGAMESEQGTGLTMLWGTVSTYKHLPCARPARNRQAWSSEIG